MTQSLSKNAAEILLNKLKQLEKYSNLGVIKNYIEDVKCSIDNLQEIEGYDYPKLPPIADIPLDDLLKEIKRRVEYHPGPIG